MTLRVERQARICNDLGLHLRAAGLLVQVATRYGCEQWLRKGQTEANAKSIMSVLSLAAGRGTQLSVVAVGDDAAGAAEALVKLIESGFTQP